MKRKTIDISLNNILNIFPQVNKEDIKRWSILFLDEKENPIANSNYLTRIKDCCQNNRTILFINSYGTIDTLVLSNVEEEHISKSSSWKRPRVYNDPEYLGGIYRNNIVSSRTVTGTYCSNEEDQEWLTQLLDSPMAWEQVNKNGSSHYYIPIVIEDTSMVVKKTTSRFEYIIEIKYYHSNEKNTFL